MELFKKHSTEENLIKEDEDTLKSQSDEKQKQFESLTSKLSSVKKEYDVSVESLISVKKEIIDIIRDNQTVKTNYNSLKKECDFVKQSLAQINTEYAEKSSKNNALQDVQKKLDVLNDTFEQKKQESSSFQESIGKLKSQLIRLEFEKKQMNLQNDKLAQKTKSQKNVKMSGAQFEKIDILNNQLLEMKKTSTLYKQKNITLNDEKSQLQKKIKVLENSKTSISNQAHSSKSEKYDSEISLKNSQLQKLVTEVKESSRQKDTLQSNVKTLYNTISQEEQKLKILNDKNKNLEISIKKYQDIKTELTDSNAVYAMRDIIEEYKKEVKHLTEELNIAKRYQRKQK